ncbi:MAG TPA: hypothetical protein VGG59_02085 [Acidobacteriaceae bacterium]
MRKTTIRASIAAFAASICLLGCGNAVTQASTKAEPAALSPEFSKAGLKALITLRNSQYDLDRSRIQATFDEAEFAASTRAEKDALFIMQRLQTDYDPVLMRARANFGGGTEYLKTCGDAMENMFRSGRKPDFIRVSFQFYGKAASERATLPECKELFK